MPALSARRAGLGRGLDALLGEEVATPAGHAQSVAVNRLRPNRLQPRRRFSEKELGELAASIRAQGVIQPIVVAVGEGGLLDIIAGERRWRAARQAGLAEVPVLVRDVAGECELLELALVENLQRSDLSPIEEAEAYRVLRERFDLSQQQIAATVGKSRVTVSNTLRLLRLPSEVRQLVSAGRLTAGQARPLLKLGRAERQRELAERAVREGLTARELETITGAGEAKTKSRGGSPRQGRDNVHDRAAQERLTKALQTRVEIRRRGRAGTVRLHFHSEEELMRIYEILLGNGEAR